MYVFVCVCVCLDMFLGTIEDLVTYSGSKVTGDCEQLDRQNAGKKFQKTFWKSITHFKESTFLQRLIILSSFDIAFSSQHSLLQIQL